MIFSQESLSPRFHFRIIKYRPTISFICSLKQLSLFCLVFLSSTKKSANGCGISLRIDIACVTALFTWWKVETYSGRNSPAARKISTVDSIYKSAFQTNSRAYNSDQHRGSRRHESVVHSGGDSARRVARPRGCAEGWTDKSVSCSVPRA